MEICDCIKFSSKYMKDTIGSINIIDFLLKLSKVSDLLIWQNVPTYHTSWNIVKINSMVEKKNDRLYMNGYIHSSFMRDKHHFSNFYTFYSSLVFFIEKRCLGVVLEYNSHVLMYNFIISKYDGSTHILFENVFWSENP